MNVYFNVTIKIVLLLIIILVYSYITCPNLHLGNSVVPFYKRTDNKFPEINEDYTHPNVSILLTSGLSNRIRTMLGFIEVCKHFTDYTGNLIGKILNGANSDREFCDYIDKYSRGKGYFLATDNRDSQEYYIKKYGKRTIVYSSIKETNSLRKTSLENAIVDIYLLSYCKSIKGTYNSSFTDFARLLKKSRNYDLKA